MKQILILISSAMLLSARLGAYTWEWKTHTSKNEFRSMCETDQILWAATEGGLLAVDPVTSDMRQWANTEGLASNNATAVCSDPAGRIWIGYYDGMVQRYDPEEGSWLRVEDYAGIPVTTLTLHGDTLFVGLEIGVSLYLVSRNEVKETYRRLGNRLDPEIPVNAILVHRDTLWVGTDQGAAYASLDFANLLDPQNWRNIVLQNGLPARQVNALCVYGQDVWLGTDSGVFRVGEGATDLAGQPIRAFHTRNENLYILTQSRVYAYNGNIWQQIGPNLSGGLSLGFIGDQIRVGTERGVLHFSEAESAWIRNLPNAPEHNKFIDFAVDQNGVLWCASAQSDGGGFSRFDGNTWRSYNTRTLDSLLTDNVCAVTVDLNNDVWLGTFGRGIVHFHADTLFEIIYMDDGIFSGIETSPEYVVVPHMVTDRLGNIWFANFESRVRRYIICRSADSLWTQYTVADGINLPRIRSLMVDAVNRLWIGSQNHGVLVYDPAGTAADKRDDEVAGSLNRSDGLEDEYITALAEDAEGTVWIGTPSGLYTYRVGDAQVTPNYYPVSDNIRAIAVDGVNNIWIGHDEGVSCRINQDYSWHHFHVDNSDLVKNDVFCLDADAASGKLYIGTDEGLSVLTTPFSEPITRMQPLRIYPNPFIPDQHINAVIDDLSQNVSVGIYSAGGFLVQKYNANDVPGRQIAWDGTDRDGKAMPSGVYLVVSKSESGEKQIGKIALVR